MAPANSACSSATRSITCGFNSTASIRRGPVVEGEEHMLSPAAPRISVWGSLMRWYGAAAVVKSR
jgi:hypothetical protein